MACSVAYFFKGLCFVFLWKKQFPEYETNGYPLISSIILSSKCIIFEHGDLRAILNYWAWFS